MSIINNSVFVDANSAKIYIDSDDSCNVHAVFSTRKFGQDFNLSVIEQMNHEYTFVIDFWCWKFITLINYRKVQSRIQSVCHWTDESWIYFCNWFLMLNFYHADKLQKSSIKNSICLSLNRWIINLLLKVTSDVEFLWCWSVETETVEDFIEDVVMKQKNKKIQKHLKIFQEFKFNIMSYQELKIHLRFCELLEFFYTYLKSQLAKI